MVNVNTGRNFKTYIAWNGDEVNVGDYIKYQRLFPCAKDSESLYINKVDYFYENHKFASIDNGKHIVDLDSSDKYLGKASKEEYLQYIMEL
jgi:hypothetical protein